MSPAWSQSYTLFGRGLAFSAIIASLPILTLLFLLGVRRKPAWFAALCALAVALVVALFAYRLPPTLTLSSAAYGAGFGLFPISWIVFWAITLYRVTVETGKFEIIKSSMGNLTSDARLQALLIAFALEHLLKAQPASAPRWRSLRPCWSVSVSLPFTPQRFAWWPILPRSHLARLAFLWSPWLGLPACRWIN